MKSQTSGKNSQQVYKVGDASINNDEDGFSELYTSVVPSKNNLHQNPNAKSKAVNQSLMQA